MKSNAPWSVKGIERDARETAKEAARREGMTVGEWLNHMIYTAGDPASTNGDIEGLKVTDLVTAIEHLNRRLGEMETASAAAVGELSRNIGGVVERTQRLERVHPGEGTDSDLAGRVEKLEQAGGDRERVDALKALEKAVTQVAVQFNNAHKTSLERIDANERQLQELAARMDHPADGNEEASGVAFLKDAIDGLSARITRAERTAKEAAQSREEAASAPSPEFIDQTGARMRVLGDEIKRGGDQMRALEGVVTKLSEQIDAAELRSAEGVQKVTETIAELKEQLVGERNQPENRTEIDAAIEASRKETDERISTLQSSFSDVMGRLGAIGGGAKDAVEPVDEPTVEPIESAVEEDAATDDDTVEAAAPLAFDISDDDPDSEDEVTDIAADLSEAEHDITKEAAETESEDPFSFDNDDAETASEKSDDFGFDFDDEGEETPSAANQARALLSEVQEAFKGEKSDGDNAAAADQLADEAGSSAADTEEDDDDLDSIFADLDALTDRAEPPVENDQDGASALSDPDKHSEMAASPLEDDFPSTSTAADAKTGEPEDYLKAARRRAKEAAQRAEEGKAGRRKLTPKQKAILAARARQKRRAAAEEAMPDATPQMAAADDAGGADDQDSKSGLMSKLTGVFSFLRRDSEDKPQKTETAAKSESQEIDYEDPHSGDKAAFATLKATVTARPVTLALGVAIVLAAAALFFLVKDLVFKPGSSNTTPSSVASQPAPSNTVDNTIETVAALPTAPAVNPRTLYVESMTALNAAASEGDYAAAIGTLEDAAALGFPPAQLQLGELYKTGQGVDQDLGQARLWFRRAANGGNVLATHRIGVMTARGDGGAADTREAIGWFERAANFGLVDSQYNLGAIYHPSGDSAASPIQDAGQAYYWYSLAAKNGDQQAGPLAAGVAVALTPAQRQDVDAAIASWVPQTPDPAANEVAVTN